MGQSFKSLPTSSKMVFLVKMGVILPILAFFAFKAEAIGPKSSYAPETYNVLLPSGVKYKVTKEVNKCPHRALIDQHVTFHYSVTLVEGWKFIGSTFKKEPFSFVLGGKEVTQGISEMILGMCVGEMREGLIHPEMGFGAFGVEKGIPPDATIVTEVELVSIKEKTGRFWNIDSDDDEKITHEEFKTFFQKKIEDIKEDPKQAHIVEGIQSEVDEYLDDLFKKTDKDKDGHVTIHEFEHVRDEL